jgi:hypothetical protein
VAQRVTQAPARVLIRADDAVARVSQAPVRSLVRPSDAVARLTQAGFQGLVQPDDGATRVSQLPVRVLVAGWAAEGGVGGGGRGGEVHIQARATHGASSAPATS